MATLNSYERAILSVLLRDGGWLNTTEIAEEAGMSWNTALKYLGRMYRKGWLARKGKYWIARR